MTDPTCYVERSKIREILIGQPDESLYITEEILREVDTLPIFTAEDFPGGAQEPTASDDPALWICFSDNGQFIRAWTRDHNRKELFRLDGLDMRPFYGISNLPAPANETRGGTGDDCSVGKRGVWPPEGSDGIAVGERQPEARVTAGETAPNPSTASNGDASK